ncbi:hypothetical protein JYK22_21575, partial [Nonomuraea sp. RK-328]|nr:hypothetical protein [Nonomuraea sp. RK-328]
MSYRVGDEVRVFDVNGARRGQPSGGWVGKVIKVGRKYVTVEYLGRTDQFEIDSGRRANDAYGHRRIKTPEQVALDARWQTALDDLRARRVELRQGHKFTLEQVEALAEMARSFASTEEG